MEETKEIQKVFNLFQGLIYFSIAIEIFVLILMWKRIMPELANQLFLRLSALPIYQNVLFSKLSTLVLILMVSIGTKPKKDIRLNPAKHIIIPLLFGLVLFFGSSVFYFYDSGYLIILGLSLFDICYIMLSFAGAVIIHVALDNVSKFVKSGLLKDRFNVENESFEQNAKYIENQYSVNIPIQYYYKKRVNKGWMNILNPFRGTLLIGTPGSGKTFSIVLPFIKQHLAKGFSMLVYDYKYPDLGKIAYYHYLINKKTGALKTHQFFVINLNDVERSKRINPLKAEYISTLADATETAEALLQALRKIDGSTGTDQFFTQSAINFLAACIFFFSRYQNGQYSTLPHVLAFINRSYAEMFSVLYSEPELESLLSPFKNAYDKQAFDQLEGQLGTLKINVSRLATKETFWVFSGDDFNLKISDKASPGVLILANDPDTQNINSAFYSVVLNRLTKLVNKPGNVPTSIIVDELPTLYFHKVENLIATARSNRVSVLLGLQEIPQLKQQYTKATADTITAVTANVIAGSARYKETLDWLEKLFGKVKQIKSGINIDRSRTSVNINEHMDHLIPASKIAKLKAGELVANIGMEAEDLNQQNIFSIYNCKVDVDLKSLNREVNNYVDLPKYYDFESHDKKNQVLKNNMLTIKRNINTIIKEF